MFYGYRLFHYPLKTNRNGLDERLCVCASVLSNDDRRFRHQLFAAEVRCAHTVRTTFVSRRPETLKKKKIMNKNVFKIMKIKL